MFAALTPPPLAAVATFGDNTIHVLCVDPLELVSYDALHRTYLITSLSSHFPYYTYGGAGSHALIALPKLDALLAYLPGLFLLFQRGKEVVSVIEIPDKREAALSIYGNNRVFFGTSSLRDAAPLRLSSALAEQSVVVMHRPGDTHFAVLDLEKMASTRVELDGLGVHEVRARKQTTVR